MLHGNRGAETNHRQRSPLIARLCKPSPQKPSSVPAVVFPSWPPQGRQNRAYLTLQGQGGLSRNCQTRDSGLRHCSTSPYHGTCPTSQTVPTYISNSSSLVPRIRKAVAACLGAMSAPSPSPGPVQPLRSALKGDNDSPSIKGTPVFISAACLHIPNSICGSSSRAHIIRVDCGGLRRRLGWIASPPAPVAFVDEGR